MFNVGTTELIVIIMIALLAVGPKGMTRLVRDLGKFAGTLRRLSFDFKRQIDDELRKEEMLDLQNRRKKTTQNTTQKTSAQTDTSADQDASQSREKADSDSAS